MFELTIVSNVLPDLEITKFIVFFFFIIIKEF